MAYGDKPFGLRKVVLTSLDGVTQVGLPAAMTFSFAERVVSGEMSGDDKLLAVVTVPDAIEWELEAGGIPLEAYALMTGRTVVTTGTTPNQVDTLTGSAQEAYPYFKVYGQAIDEASGDFHCKLYKCKLTSGMKGQLANGDFWQSGVSGLGMDDGTNGVWDWVQNETTTTLPTS